MRRSGRGPVRDRRRPLDGGFVRGNTNTAYGPRAGDRSTTEPDATLGCEHPDTED